MEQVAVQLTVVRGGDRVKGGDRVRLGRARVVAQATYRLEAPVHRRARLQLLDFAGALKGEPHELDPVAVGGYLDGPFDPGWIRVSRTEGVQTLERDENGHFVVELGPGTRSFVLHYEVRVPRRPWPFGCLRRRCSLSGALAPLPAAPVEGGRWLGTGAIPHPARWTVEVRLAQPDPDLEVLVVAPDDADVAYPSVFWGPRWNRLEGDHGGTRVRILHPRARAAGRVPHESVVQPRRDVPGRLEHIAHESVDLMAAAGQELDPGGHLTVIQGPLRAHVAESHPHVVMVSDQAYQLMPSHRFLRFHEAAIARATLDELWMRVMVAHQSPSVALWMMGALGAATTSLWEQRREHPDEYARDILRNFTFMPAVDRFLYTGQATFSESYFRGAEDVMKVRNHPLWFGHELPTGRRIHEKLVDTLGPRRLSAAYDEILRRPGADVQPVFARAYGHTLDWFFDQWLGPYPSVDYAIVAVTSHPVANGFRHRVVVEKRGDRPLIEPVQLLLEDRGGHREFLVWNGQLAGSTALEEEPRRGRHTFETTSPAKLRVVRLDPRRRLLEVPQPPRRNVDPEFNNRKPVAPRFLYTGAGLSVAASEFVNAATPNARFSAVDAFAFFEASRRHDLGTTGHVQLFHDRETWVGAAGGANLWFGAKQNRQRRRGRVSVFQTAEWLNGLGLDPGGGLRLVESLSIQHDNRGFFMWPQRGHRVGTGVGARQTLRVDGASDHRYDLVARAEWVQLWPLPNTHVLATNLGVAMVFPLASEMEFRGLVRGGGIGALGGYGGNELFGLASAWVRAEYRHEFFRNLNINVVHLAWLRHIGGVAFAGVSSLSRCDSYRGWFERESWYGQVGYGLTARTFIFGVTPQFVRLGVAVPTVRRTTTCLDRVLPNYLAQVQGLPDASQLLSPVNVNLTFVQPF